MARQSFLSNEKTLRRKLKEIVVASRLESEFNKKQILEWYLNKVYFGDGLYGVEAASLGYFGKHASELDVAESALLAGLVKAPSSYAPTVSVDRALARRRVALNAMRQAGAIDTATFESADGRELHLQDGLRKPENYGSTSRRKSSSCCSNSARSAYERRPQGVRQWIPTFNGPPRPKFCVL